MTLFICQCPHRLPAKVWTADHAAQAIDYAIGESDLEPFDDVLEAARYDMRDAYVTDDPFDLWLWISGNEAPRATRAAAAFFRDHATRSAVEDAAARHDRDDDTIYTAFDDRFTWSEDDGEWRLDNQPPVEADDLAHALTAASLALAFQRQEEHDV